MKVLIADDDPASRSLLTRHVEKLGHEVTTASDGPSAWNLFRATRPEVLISDWLMPGLDGPELCRWVRSEDWPTYTYVIMTTILGGKACNLESIEAGADDFLSKPIDADVLAARLIVAARVVAPRRAPR